MSIYFASHSFILYSALWLASIFYKNIKFNILNSFPSYICQLKNKFKKNIIFNLPRTKIKNIQQKYKQKMEKQKQLISVKNNIVIILYIKITKEEKDIMHDIME